jgi:streptogramin lyase
MARVFISYRRDDCAGHAGRLYDHLVERFGDDAVFMDVDGIEPGVDFGQRIEAAVGACDVLIALIGDDWLDIVDSAGRRRLDDPADLVRLEIAGALRRSDLRVIPVLVEGAAMPRAEQLPDDLRPLAGRNALELSDGRWRYDADRLIEVVEPPGRLHGVPKSVLAAAGAIVAIAIAIALLAGGGGTRRAETPSTSGTPSTPPPPSQRVLVAGTPIPLVSRPNSLAFTGNDVVALGARNGDLGFVDAATSQEDGQRVEDVGRGANDMAVGFGSLWVTKHTEGSLIRIDPRQRNRAGAAIKPQSGMLVAVATGEGAVWVGAQEKSGSSSVLELTPQGRRVQTIRVGGAISDITVGEGAVWVTTRPATVVRISARDGTTQAIHVGRDPRGIATGDGAVWVANAGDKSVTRINSKTRAINRPIRLDVVPERVAVGGGFVWVTAPLANRLIPIDSRRLKVKDAIETGHEPYAVGVYRGDVWLTLADGHAIQRVRFTG